MVYDFYGSAVREYLAEFEETTRKIERRLNIPKEEINYQIQSERDNINKLIETNQNYAKLLMDLQLYKKNCSSNMFSLTQFAKRKNEKNPGYVIQAWLRERSTLEFLRLWEREFNKEFNDETAKRLIERTHEPSFTLTAKIWISETNAKGISSKQGSGGGTLAVDLIAIDFITWLLPERRYDLIKLISLRLLTIECE